MHRQQKRACCFWAPGLTILLLSWFLPVISGRNYVNCFQVERRVVKVFNPVTFELEHKNILKKGPTVGRRALYDIFQYLNSSFLFGGPGYINNIVCQYHFTITQMAVIVFDKIHLDRNEQDPDSGMATFEECKEASRGHRKDRDYIAMNVNFDNGQPNVFCGQHNERVVRKVHPEDIPEGKRDLVITFWSDSSDIGQGFSGYYYQGNDSMIDSMIDNM